MAAQNAIKGASKKAIQFHYDVSNEFYSLWLDPKMIYSCGIWKDGDDLAQAQTRKIDYHIQQIALSNAESVLDIGCGWGGVMNELVRHGIKSAVGLTLSRKQYDYINENYTDPVISAYLESWEFHEPKRPYDGIISIGAFEHFAKLDLTEKERINAYRSFFKKCHSLLNNGCRLSLQTIGCGNMLRKDFSKFFSNEIFPESDLPRLSEIVSASEFLFEIKNLRNDRLDYAKTIKVWKANLKENRKKAIELTSEEVVKRYELYFQLAILSFDTLATMDLYRITFEKISKPRRV